MKNFTLPFLVVIAFIFLIPAIGAAQSYNDLIITKKQDTLWCYITDVINTNITYDFHRERTVHKGFIDISEVKKIELSVPSRDNFTVYYDINGNIMISPVDDSDDYTSNQNSRSKTKSSSEDRIEQLEDEIKALNEGMDKAGVQFKEFSNAYFGGFTLTIVSSIVLGLSAVTPVGATVIVLASVGVLVGEIIIIVAHTKIGKAGEILMDYEEW